MKALIATDLHFGAPNEWMDYSKAFYYAYNYKMNNPEAFLVSLGDNFDYANMRKKEISKWEKIEKSWDIVFHESMDGNHARRDLTNKVVKRNNICFAHGDFEFWGEEKAIKYRSKPQGAGFLKRGIVVNGIEFVEKHFESKINGEFIMRAANTAGLNNCTTFVCGHRHTEKIYDQIHDGFRIIVCPRGFTELEF